MPTETGQHQKERRQAADGDGKADQNDTVEPADDPARGRGEGLRLLMPDRPRSPAKKIAPCEEKCFAAPRAGPAGRGAIDTRLTPPVVQRQRRRGQGIRPLDTVKGACSIRKTGIHFRGISAKVAQLLRISHL